MENIWSWIRPKLFPTFVFALGGGFILFVAAFSYAYFTVQIPNINNFVTTQSTVIQYADGSELGRLGAQNRTIVSLANVPLKVREAVLAAEDRNFYTESAVSPLGIARALFRDLSGGTFQGGSTITQQYAKNAFLTQSRTVTRKIKEIVISMKLEKQL